MIRVFDPHLRLEDLASVATALQNGEISGNFGTSLERFEIGFSSYVGCAFGVATSSGTTALHLALAAAGIGCGDEVIVSSSTNIATALAAVYLGAVPVPADVKADSWNIDPDHVESLITSRTKAIIPVHLFGAAADMDRIMSIAERHDLLVVEDCAQAHGARWNGRPVGSFGHMAAFSFYANKAITTGEGGMVTSNDRQLADRMRYLKNLAFTEPRFRHTDIGYNYRMAGYQAALGLEQLARIENIIEAKRSLAYFYRNSLKGVEAIQWQAEPQEMRHVHWMAALNLRRDSKLKRDDLARVLYEKGIETRTFFCPMNQQPALQALEGFPSDPCPVADRLWTSGLYLPSSLSLTDKDLSLISDLVRDSL